MYQFIFAFCAGIYVGTFYDCKPTIFKIQDIIKNCAPPKNNDTPEKNDATTFWPFNNKPKSPKN